MSFIEMKDIRKDFGKLTILHGVNMNLEKGGFFLLSAPPVPEKVPSSVA